MIAVERPAVPVERLHHAARPAQRAATTRGTATRSSGPPPARRRPTTSTRCRQSAPSGRSSTSSTARSLAHAVALPARAGETYDEMRADAPEEDLGEPVEGHDVRDGERRGDARGLRAAPDATPHDDRPPRRGARPQHEATMTAALRWTTASHGELGHGRAAASTPPCSGMLLFIGSEVMFFAGLFAAYFNARAAGSAELAARGHRASSTPIRLPLIVTIILVHQLVHDAVGRRGASARATARA